VACQLGGDEARRGRVEYLAIAAQWLRGLGMSDALIAQSRQESLVWAIERGSRSGRVAFQFAKDYSARHAG
jgi:predicted AAA+ superfamily ATPase